MNIQNTQRTKHKMCGRSGRGQGEMFTPALKIQNTKYKTQNTKCKIQNTEYKI